MNRQSWSAEEDEAITRLVGEYGLNDWTRIAAKLREEEDISHRTGKQCRERWYNHLNPSVNKQPWHSDEEHRLFQLHKVHGNRWKDISRSFAGRTDNDIKNHFYSTLRRSLRRLNKMLGQKNSTSQMREIKPSVLSTIMNHIYGKHEANLNHNLCRSLKDLPSLIFEYANFKPVKNNLRCHRIDEAKTKIAEIFTLIASFNEEYERAKEARHHGKTSKAKGKNDNKKVDQIERRVGEIKIEQMESRSQKEEKQNEGTEVCIKAPETPKIQNHSDEEDKEEEEGKSYHPRNRNMSLDDDEIHDQLQDIEQPSRSEGEDGPDLMIVGKHWEPKSWQRQLQMKQFVDEVLEISYGGV